MPSKDPLDEACTPQIVLLPGHTEQWALDVPAILAGAAVAGRANRQQLAKVAHQMAEQDVEPRHRYRLALWAGFSEIEAATISKMVKTEEWREDVRLAKPTSKRAGALT